MSPEASTGPVGADAPPGGRGAARRRALLALLALVVVFGLQLGDLDRPWSGDIGGFVGACWVGTAARNFERLGLGPSRGVPLVFAHPTVPTLVSPYVNHPPLAPWLFQAGHHFLGRDIAALRIVSLAAALLLLLGLFLLLRSEGDSASALLVVGLAAALPIGQRFYCLVDAILPSCAGLVLLAALWFWRRRGGGRAVLALMALTALINAGLDWHGYAVVVAATLDACLRPRGERGRALREALLVLGGFQALGLAAYFAWLRWASVALDQDLIAQAFSNSVNTAFGDRFGPADWLPALWHWLDLGLGRPIMTVGGLGLLATLLPRGRRLLPRAWPRLLLFFLVAGLIPSLLFWQHFIVHDFWPLPLVPFFALAVASGLLVVGGLLASRPRRSEVVVALLLVALLVQGIGYGWRLRRERDTDRHLVQGRSLAAWVGPEDLVISAGTDSPLRYYAPCPLIPEIDTAEKFAELGRLLQEKGCPERVFYLWPLNARGDGQWARELPHHRARLIPWGRTEAVLGDLYLEGLGWRSPPGSGR